MKSHSKQMPMNEKVHLVARKRIALTANFSLLLFLFTLPLYLILSPLPAIALSAPTISAVRPGNGYLEVSFTSVSSAAQYQYSTDGGLTFTTRPRTTEGLIQTWSPMTIHGLENGRSYSVIIRALDGAGSPGSNSNTVNQTPNPQTRNLGSNEAVLQGTYVEVGTRSSGAFGTTVSIGSNFHAFANNANCLGFRVDRQKNGWGDASTRAVKVGSTFINVDDGDYFCPGSPYEGWALKVGGAAKINNNDNSSGLAGSVGSVVIGDSAQTVSWTSGSANNGIKVFQNAIVPNSGQSLHIDVTLTNVTGSTISNIYYGRGYDPDNGTGTSSGTSNEYTSTNTITSIGGGSSAAIVRSTFPSGAQIFLRSNDSRARAAIETSGFSGAPDPVEIWNGNGAFNRGGTSTSDQGVGVALKIDSLGLLNPLSNIESRIAK